MKYALCSEIKTDPRAMRDVYCQTMIDMAEHNDRIVQLDCDLMNSAGTVPFAEAHPQRTVNCGIMEANMMGVAAGMSTVGMIPFAHTFACFATRRALDQIFVSAAFNHANIRIIGSDPGVTAATNGGTHMPFEDIGSLRDIPNITILEPTDTVMLEHLLRRLEQVQGVYYLRLSRKNVPQVYQPGSAFQIGSAAVLREGGDVTLIASGLCVAECLRAADELAQQGIEAGVMDMFTIKPIDKRSIVQAARQSGAVVTVENHNIHNGLGSAVAEVLGEHCPVPMQRIGIADQFGEAATMDYLKEKFGLTAANIATTARAVIARKGKR